MACYNIAGFPVRYDAVYPTLQNNSAKYRCNDTPDAFPLRVTESQIAAIREDTPLLTDDLREYMLMGKAFYEYLIDHGYSPEHEITICEKLSYPDEQIVQVTLGEAKNMDFGYMCVVII